MSAGRQLGAAGLPLPPLTLQGSIFATEAGKRPGEHVNEVHATLHPLHQAQRDQETTGLGGKQVTEGGRGTAAGAGVVAVFQKALVLLCQGSTRGV